MAKKAGVKNPKGTRALTKGEAYKAGRRKAMQAGKDKRKQYLRKP